MQDVGASFLKGLTKLEKMSTISITEPSSVFIQMVNTYFKPAKYYEGHQIQNSITVMQKNSTQLFLSSRFFQLRNKTPSVTHLMVSPHIPHFLILLLIGFENNKYWFHEAI